MMRILTVVVLVLAAACSPGPSGSDDASYIAAVEVRRAAKQDFMRSSEDSPIPADKKNILLPLPYYPIDPAMSAPAALRLADDRPVFEMPTSQGTSRRMQLVGTLEFTLLGQKMSLGAFVPDGEAIIDLFVPFADETTGTETYPAGRYLDLRPTGTGVYLIDFNDAYNPSCAYNSAYECPYPPPSNRLKVAIRAGEKMPAEHAG